MFKKDKVQDLKDKSLKVLNIFSQTVIELSRLNIDLEQEMEDREQTILELKREGALLTETRDHNNKVIEKINSFIEI